MHSITVTSLEPYLQIKEAILSRFMASPLQQCFKLLDLPPLGDRHLSALFTKMQVLLPHDANILCKVMFLRHLLETMRTALAD